jgi:putative endopeptidase
LEKLSKLVSTIPLDEWKRYLAWHLASDYAPLLSEPFVHASFDFWGKTISGSKKLKPLWRRALSTTSSILDEPIGKLYVKRYFPPEAKRAMNALVDDLFKAYEMRMKKLTWIGPKTKRRAIKKLRTMERKIGYPSRWRSFRKLVIKTDDYVGNCVRAAEFEHHRDLRRLTKPVDRNEWITAPQIVNAYAHLNLNDITFPAAILQPPFFDLSADAAVNYAAIGSCIGHEMTHGFDDRGSKFDEKGNHHTWWEARDRKRFEHKSHILVKQFNRYEAADGIMVHGKLTLGENIADLGGLSIAYDAFVRHLEKTGRKNINGLTPEQRFFLGFAQQEQELARKEFMKMAALIDPHSPAETRVNGPLSNFPPFYATYNVKKGDGLYREPKDRAKIW